MPPYIPHVISLSKPQLRSLFLGRGVKLRKDHSEDGDTLIWLTKSQFENLLQSHKRGVGAYLRFSPTQAALHRTRHGRGIAADAIQKTKEASKSLFSGFKEAAKAAGSAVGSVVGAIKDRFSGLREGAPPAVRDFLAKRGDAVVNRLLVKREPIQTFLNTILNFISVGQWNAKKKELGYDDLFHLYVIMFFQDGSPPIKIERNHVVEISQYDPRDNKDSMPVPMNGKTTTPNILLQGAAAKKGNAFWRYDPGSNNCQDFVKDMLATAGFLTPQLQAFIHQDAETLLKQMNPKIRSFMQGTTDLAHRLDVIINGKGMRGGRVRLPDGFLSRDRTF